MRAMIAGAGHFVPQKKLTNAQLEKMVDTTDEWIVSRTGIHERRILESGRATSFMAVKAAEQALEQAEVNPSEIDLIILATVTPDMTVPSAAALVQRDLKASNCWGFDLNGGCSGFIYALSTASQFLESGKYQKILVVGADKMSSIIDYEDRNTCVIFGDGAGAVLLKNTESAGFGILDFDLHLDGEGAQYLHIEAGGSLQPASHQSVEERKHFVYQDGRSVFKHAVKGMADVSAAMLEKHNLTAKDVKYLIPHQANFRIIDSVAKKLGLSKEQTIVNIEKYGNTTAATIPIALSEASREGRLAKGDWILLSAFGAGFTWGSVLMRWAL